jgi:hypothetical protein
MARRLAYSVIFDGALGESKAEGCEPQLDLVNLRRAEEFSGPLVPHLNTLM